ncbi:hypothetical protein F5Y06DRAFT_267629 [Hypoxylon sp. FL0890]|nr:hypothetical protein F5Y06DRAFT_267629 [Hypoxylon sp. FL0890]
MHLLSLSWLSMVAVRVEAPLGPGILVQRYELPAQITRGTRPPGDEAANVDHGAIQLASKNRPHRSPPFGARQLQTILEIRQFQRTMRTQMTPLRPISGIFSVIASDYPTPSFVSRGRRLTRVVWAPVPLRGLD